VAKERRQVATSVQRATEKARFDLGASTCPQTSSEPPQLVADCQKHVAKPLDAMQPFPVQSVNYRQRCAMEMKYWIHMRSDRVM